MIGSVGRRYAKAIFALAKDRQALDATAEEIQKLAAVADDPGVRSVLANPMLTASRRQQIAEALIRETKAAEMTARFVRLLADRQRLGELPGIARAFLRLLDQEQGRVRVNVRAPMALSAEQQKDVLSAFATLTGKSVVPSFEVDPALLGGVVVEAEGKVYDGSIKTQLERLAKQLSGVAH